MLRQHEPANSRNAAEFIECRAATPPRSPPPAASPRDGDDEPAGGRARSRRPSQRRRASHSRAARCTRRRLRGDAAAQQRDDDLDNVADPTTERTSSEKKSGAPAARLFAIGGTMPFASAGRFGAEMSEERSATHRSGTTACNAASKASFDRPYVLTGCRAALEVRRAQAIVHLVSGEEYHDAVRRQALEEVRRAVDRHRLLRVALADGRARERGEVHDGVGRDGTDQRLGCRGVAQIERPRRHLREIFGKCGGASERAGHLKLVAERGAQVGQGSRRRR